MRPKRIAKPYTTDEIATIFNMYNDGGTMADIAEATGRSVSAIKGVIHNYRDRAEDYIGEELDTAAHYDKQIVVPSEPSKPKDLSPREMIKRLYDMGYRIENNKIVYIEKKVIQLQDIITNG